MAYPSNILDVEQKAGKEYILDFVKGIFAEHNYEFIDTERRSKMKNLRTWAEGSQDIDHLIPLCKINSSDPNYSNIDYTPIAEGKTLVNKIVNYLVNAKYDINVSCLDAYSKTKKDEFFYKEKAKIMLNPAMQAIKEQTGIDLVQKQKEGITDQESLDRYMEFDFKHSTQIAMELILQFLLKYNFVDEYFVRKIYKDIVIIKEAALYCYNDNDGVTKIRYADPENLIYSAIGNDETDKITYCGEVKYVRLMDIINNSNTDEFSHEDIEEIAETFSDSFGNAKWERKWNGMIYTNGCYDLPYIDFRIPIFEFEFKEPSYVKKEAKTNKYGNRRVHNKKSTFVQSEFASKSAKLYEFIEERRYKGSWILDTDFIYNCGEAENSTLLRGFKGSDKELPLGYTIIAPDRYDGKSVSLLETMVSYLEQMQLSYMKMQQTLANNIPSGYAYDLDGLENIALGKGDEATDPLEIVSMHRQIATLVYRSKGEDGNTTQGIPVTPIQSHIINDIEAHIKVYQVNRELLYSVVGWNSAMDGQPDRDALPGIQKMQAQATNIALLNIKHSYKHLMERTLYVVCNLVQDALVYSDVKEFYRKSIGNDSLFILDNAKDIDITEYGITIEYLPTDEDRADLLQALQLSLQQQSIKASDYIKIKNMYNLKMAYLYLRKAEKDYAKEKQDMSMQMSSQNAQDQASVAAASTENKKQVLMLENQAKSELMQVEYDLKNNFAIEEHKRQIELLSMRLQNNIDAKQITVEGQKDVAQIYDDNFNLNK